MANAMLEAALHYHSLGYTPIPCRPREKRPLVAWKDFQVYRPTPEQLQAWFEQWPDANLALVLGRGRYAVDLDGGDEAEALLANAGIMLPPDAPRSRTGNGYHVFLSTYNPIPDRIALLSTEGGKPQVDIRGIGIVVVPPSIHPNGKTYEWIRPLVEKPPHGAAELTELIHRTEAPVSAATGNVKAAGNRFWVADALRGVGDGQRDHMCTKLAGFFIAKGLDSDTTIAVINDTFGRLCSPPFPPRDVEKCVLSIARRQSVANETRGIRPKHVSEVLEEFTASMAAGPSPTLPTPFHQLNFLLSGGFAPGEMIYLGARPGSGKTALGLEIARHAAKQRKGAVLVISREMTNLALARRLVAQDGRVKAAAIKETTLNVADQWRVKESVQRLAGMPLFMVDDAVSMMEIQAIVEEMATQAPLALVVVDYLQLIRAPAEVKERRHQVDAVSQALKTIALQYRAPVLCLSSLSRPGNDEKGKPPGLSSLRESGQLEHDADIIMLLHREQAAEHTECRIAKNRDGRIGTVNLLFKSEYVAFDEGHQGED